MLLALALLVGPGLGSAAAEGPLQRLRERLVVRFAPLVQPRQARLIRACRAAHDGLRGVLLPLPEGEVLPAETARTKTYGASWTCRESSRLLIQRLAAEGKSLQLDSSGKDAFQWGDLGRVSFHYYAVDRGSQPRLLVDPTAISNFALDVQVGGLMRRYLEEAGRRLGEADAARRVLGRMLAARPGDLFILRRPAEIAVYREALERAADRLRELSRDAERTAR